LPSPAPTRRQFHRPRHIPTGQLAAEEDDEAEEEEDELQQKAKEGDGDELVPETTGPPSCRTARQGRL
jgi:hypothetical protein